MPGCFVRPASNMQGYITTIHIIPVVICVSSQSLPAWREKRDLLLNEALC